MTAAPAASPEPLLQAGVTLLPPRGARGWALHLALANRGSRGLHVLEWATPFEGWLAPWLRVWHDGVELPYQGAMAKRGDPAAAEYLRIGAGRQREVTLELAPAFALGHPGRYRLEPRLALADVVVAPAHPPRQRSAFQPLLLAAAAFEQLVPPR